jgi:hypothetical protein
MKTKQPFRPFCLLVGRVHNLGSALVVAKQHIDLTAQVNLDHRRGKNGQLNLEKD